MDDKEVEARVKEEVTRVLGGVLKPIAIDALTERLMNVIVDVAGDEYERGYNDGDFNRSYYGNK